MHLHMHLHALATCMPPSYHLHFYAAAIEEGIGVGAPMEAVQSAQRVLREVEQANAPVTAASALLTSLAEPDTLEIDLHAACMALASARAVGVSHAVIGPAATKIDEAKAAQAKRDGAGAQLVLAAAGSSDDLDLKVLQMRLDEAKQAGVLQRLIDAAQAKLDAYGGGDSPSIILAHSRAAAAAWCKEAETAAAVASKDLAEAKAARVSRRDEAQIALHAAQSTMAGAVEADAKLFGMPRPTTAPPRALSIEAAEGGAKGEARGGAKGGREGEGGGGDHGAIAGLDGVRLHGVEEEGSISEAEEEKEKEKEDKDTVAEEKATDGSSILSILHALPFEQLDADGDGTLSRSELSNALAQALGRQPTPSELSHVWTSIDADGDGTVTADEWQNMPPGRQSPSGVRATDEQETQDEVAYTEWLRIGSEWEACKKLRSAAGVAEAAAAVAWAEFERAIQVEELVASQAETVAQRAEWAQKELQSYGRLKPNETTKTIKPANLTKPGKPTKTAAGGKKTTSDPVRPARRGGGCCGSAATDVVTAAEEKKNNHEKAEAAPLEDTERAGRNTGKSLVGFDGLSWAPLLLPRAPEKAELLLRLALAQAYSDPAVCGHVAVYVCTLETSTAAAFLRLLTQAVATDDCSSTISQLGLVADTWLSTLLPVLLASDAPVGEAAELVRTAVEAMQSHGFTRTLRAMLEVHAKHNASTPEVACVGTDGADDGADRTSRHSAADAGLVGITEVYICIGHLLSSSMVSYPLFKTFLPTWQLSNSSINPPAALAATATHLSATVFSRSATAGYCKRRDERRLSTEARDDVASAADAVCRRPRLSSYASTNALSPLHSALLTLPSLQCKRADLLAAHTLLTFTHVPS